MKKIRLSIRLSEFLTEKFKKGFSEVNLKNAHLFYNIYSKSLQKRQTVSAEPSSSV